MVVDYRIRAVNDMTGEIIEKNFCRAALENAYTAMMRFILKHYGADDAKNWRFTHMQTLKEFLGDVSPDADIKLFNLDDDALFEGYAGELMENSQFDDYFVLVHYYSGQYLVLHIY